MLVEWVEKLMYLQESKRDIFCSLSHEWLKSAKLKAETEGLLFAAQDQSLTMSS